MARTTIRTEDITDSSIQSLKNRNRIINGDMRIDQRNAGASVTVSGAVYGVDRFRAVQTGGTGVFTIQQDSSYPSGFIKSLKATVTTAYSPTTTDRYEISQLVEGNNTADLNWGTAAASPVTLSFWVRSSLTGTFGGVVQNENADYNYVFSYSISAADTWEYKTITVSGPTTGTWATGNGQGLKVTFSIGCGSTRLGTAGSWSSTRYEGATGQTQLIATNGATWYITGVQLEVGDVATPFEHRIYGEELALCQRYYTEATPQMVHAFSSTQVTGKLSYPMTMRATPTGTIKSGTASVDPISGAPISPSSININVYEYGLNDSMIISSNYSGLTTNKTYWANTTSMIFGMDAEL